MIFDTVDYYGGVDPMTATPAQHMAAIRAAAAALQTAGSGVLQIGGPDDVQVYPTTSDLNPLGAFNGCSYVEIRSNGRKLSPQCSLGAGNFCRVFQFNDCDWIVCRDTTFVHASHATHTADRGFDVYYVIGECQQSEFNLVCRGGYTGVSYARNTTDPETDIATGVHNVHIASEDTSYPCTIQGGVMGLDLELWAIRPVRSFLAHGNVARLRAKITSIDPFSQDVLIHSDGKPTITGGNNPRDWDVDYWRMPDSGSVSPVGFQSLALGFRGLESQSFTRLRIKAVVEGGAHTSIQTVTFFAQDNSDTEITSLGNMPALTIDQLDLDIHCKNRLGGAAAVDCFFDPKWAALTVKQARLNLFVEGSSNPQILIGWHAFRTILECNLQAPMIQYAGQRPPSLSGPFSIQSLTPIWKGSVTDPAIGNGTLLMTCTRTFDVLEVDILLVSGSTTTYGAGGLFFQLPPPFDTWLPKNHTVGSALVVDAGVPILGTCRVNAGWNAIGLVTNGIQWDANNPITPAPGDEFWLNVRIKKA